MHTEIRQARIDVAGVLICIDGQYLFALGAQSHHGRTPVYRVGGHREGHESAWECAAREALEETGLRIHYLAPPATWLLADGDHVDSALERIAWENAEDQAHAPFLVVAYRRKGEFRLSVMYLAKTNEIPSPASEVKGLVLLGKSQLDRLCHERITLAQFLHEGGTAFLTSDFDRSLELELFAQPRLLARILSMEDERSESKNLGATNCVTHSCL